MSVISRYSSYDEAVKVLLKKGYTHEFKLIDGNIALITSNSTVQYTPDQLRIVEHHRFPAFGEVPGSDVVFAITTHNGQKGILQISYFVDSIDMSIFRLLDRIPIEQRD